MFTYKSKKYVAIFHCLLVVVCLNTFYEMPFLFINAVFSNIKSKVLEILRYHSSQWCEENRGKVFFNNVITQANKFPPKTHKALPNFCNMFLKIFTGQRKLWQWRH